MVGEGSTEGVPGVAKLQGLLVVCLFLQRAAVTLYQAATALALRWTTALALGCTTALALQQPATALAPHQPAHALHLAAIAPAFIELQLPLFAAVQLHLRFIKLQPPLPSGM